MKTVASENIPTTETTPASTSLFDHPAVKANPKLGSFIVLRANGWSLGKISEQLGVPRSTLYDWQLRNAAAINRNKLVRMERIQEEHMPSYENQLQQLGRHLQKVEAALAERDYKDMTTASLLTIAVRLRSVFNRLRREMPIDLSNPDSAPYTGCVSHLDQPAASNDTLAHIPPCDSPRPTPVAQPTRTLSPERGQPCLPEPERTAAFQSRSTPDLQPTPEPSEPHPDTPPICPDNPSDPLPSNNLPPDNCPDRGADAHIGESNPPPTQTQNNPMP